MRYHLFLNFVRKVGKIAKVFSRKLAVPRYMSTSVHWERKGKDGVNNLENHGNIIMDH